MTGVTASCRRAVALDPFTPWRFVTFDDVEKQFEVDA